MRLEAAEHVRQDRQTAETVRRCAVTRRRLAKDSLIRFVIDPDGTIVPDIREKLPGRGVWLTAAHDTVADATKRNVFTQALKTKVSLPENLASQVDGLLAEAALSALALANKAGDVVFGAAKIEETMRKGRVIALIHAKEAAEDGRRKLDGKALAMTGGEPIPTIRIFTEGELGLASGRTNVIHAALIQGGAARKFLAAAARLERYRKGSAAFANESRVDTE
ncbi:MAG: RNA-binding protein [Alphaproteobacteria bacterium]|nr:RNA-binding protein [Alphaproteobacteria bacterium]